MATRLQPKLERPFVGLEGTHNTVAVLHQDNRIICRLNGWAYLLVLVVTFVFGPMLLNLLWFRPAGTIDLSKQPLLLAALILLIPVISTLLFVHHLFTQHRIEVLRDSGNINFFKRNSGSLLRTLGKQDIARFEIGEEWFRPSRGRPVRNYVLSAICKNGNRVALCLSTDENLIRTLASDMARITDRQVNEVTP
jgi:hypothetical protein